MSYRRDDREWDYRRRDPRDRNYSPPPRDHREQRDGRDRDFRGGRPPWDDRPFRPANRARSPPPSGGFRDNRDIRGRDGDRDRERDRYPYSRDRSRDRTPPRPSLNAPGPSRPLSVRGSPPRPSRELEKSGAKGRSATPEEGQITSPVPPPSAIKPPERRRSPPPASTFRRRSPSPPPSTAGRYRFDSSNLRDGRDRDRDREPPWQRRDRGDRDRPFTRDRSRSPPSLQTRAPPPPSRSNRGRSPSISSSSSVSRSTRSPSLDKRIPEKRAYSPARSRRPYSPKRRSISPPPPTGPGSSCRSIDRRSVDRAPVEPERKPRIPVPVPLSGVKPPWAERAERRLPPSGPRSDRIPTGPRALSGGPPIVHVAPLARTNPYGAPTATPLSSSIQTEAKSRYEPISINTNINAENTIAQDRSNPYNQPTPSSSTPSGRLSWSERKALSPQKSAQPLGPDPTKPSVVPSGPSYNSQENLHRAAESSVKVDMDPSRAPPKQPSSSPVNQLSSLERSQPDPEAETRDVKMDVDDQMAGGVKSPEELAAEQRRQEEERIMRELPALQVPFGLMQWEIDLNAHYKHVQTLAAQTSRAQTAARLAQAFLADAEAERLAAVDRRRIAESQLNGSLGTGLLGTGT